jgi:PTS system nitrogen regulatory IIA component
MQISVRDTAQLLNVSEKSIYRWIKDSIIPFYKINETYRFNRTEILEWATARHMKLSPAIFLEADTSTAILPSLAEAIKAGGILYRIGGNDQASVLQSLVDAIKLPDDVDREFLYQVLLARETLGSTGIGNGIAIPHVRNPVILHVAKPTVTLCFLEQAIDFNALDGKPVNVLFAIISPTVRAHLHLLSRTGFVLHNQDLKEALARQAPREELMNLIARAEAAIPMARP